jgi:hypothetical protein
MFIITAARARESMLFITVPAVRAGESMFIITAARSRESVFKTDVN